MGESGTPKATDCPSTGPPPAPQYSASYLAELLKDKKQLAAFPNVFQHLDRLIDEEVSKVRVSLFQFEFNKAGLELPDNDGSTVQTMQEKVYVPVADYPEYNFVGRILGPRGMTAKQLEQETGCKIMVRGKGSMRDKKKEEANRGKPNWEHLSDELHVLIQCEDTEARCKVKLQRAVQEINKLLVPAPEGEDELKRKQLMELAIINGTYRPSNAGAPGAAAAGGRLLTPMTLPSPMRSPTLGAPIILSPSRGVAASQPQSVQQGGLAGGLPAGLASLMGQPGMGGQQGNGLFLPTSVADLTAAQGFVLNGQHGLSAQGLPNGAGGQDQLALAAMQQAALAGYNPYGLQSALASPLLAGHPDYAALDPAGIPYPRLVFVAAKS